VDVNGYKYPMTVSLLSEEACESEDDAFWWWDMAHTFDEYRATLGIPSVFE
jgi:hypothetical protein